MVSRWGTWIEAAVYYATNYEKIKEIMSQFDSDDAASIGICQDLLEKPNLKTELVFISASFHRIPEFITKLECTSQSLATTLAIMEEIKLCVETASGPKAAPVKKKLHDVLQRNIGYHTLEEIKSSRVLEGVGNHTSLGELSVKDIASYKYAQVASVDVERSFSRYKELLSDKRCSLTVKFKNGSGNDQTDR